MLPTVRAVSLANYIEVARFVGLDPYAMLRAAKINPEVLGDPEYRLPAAAAVGLLAASAERSGCPSFGLLIAECRSFASLGPISLLLEHQPSVRAMIEAMIRHQRHLNDILNMTLEDDGATAAVRFDYAPDFADPQVVEYSVAIFYRSLTEIMRGRWHPECVHLTGPPPADPSTHRRLFQCRLDFDAGFDGFSCPSAWLDLPNIAADPVMAHQAERLLNMVPVASPDGAVAEKTRQAIYLLIHSGGANLERVAGTLGLHPRALQRQLEQEGWSFAGLLNETRRELAQRYLAGRHHPLATISQLAGYSNQSAFTRWFTGEFGQSPATWRPADAGAGDAARAS